MRFGINGNLDEQTLPYIVDAGFTMYRCGIQMQDVLQPDGTWDWTIPDQTAALCRLGGLRWFVTAFWPLGGSHLRARWPQLERDGMHTLADVPEWEFFLEEVCIRYGDILDRIEVGQSPNCGSSGWVFPTGSFSLRTYVDFFYKTRRLVTEIIGSMRLPHIAAHFSEFVPASTDPEVNLAYFQELTDLGLYAELDPPDIRGWHGNLPAQAAGVQFYYNNEWCTPRVMNAFVAGIRELRRIVGSGVRIVITEAGWPVVDGLVPFESGDKRFPSRNYLDGIGAVDEATQCHRIERFIHYSSMPSLGITDVFLHTIKDGPWATDPARETVWGDRCGLLRPDLTPRLAYQAAKDAISAHRAT